LSLVVKQIYRGGLKEMDGDGPLPAPEIKDPD
jgi:hypothetical protein